jgi:hypothetical protein
MVVDFVAEALEGGVDHLEKVLVLRKSISRELQRSRVLSSGARALLSFLKSGE